MRDIDIPDKRFSRFILPNASLGRIAEGCRWTEGTVWFGDAGCLPCSDVPNKRILRRVEGPGVSVYRRPSHFTNGGTCGRKGRLISCLHRARCDTHRT